MKRINVMVSDEAKLVILAYQEDNNISTLDEATDKYVLETNKLRKKKVKHG